MKKQLIGALVGSLILFFWQFFSWSFSGIHDSQMAYTPQQEVLLKAITDANLEEQTYFLPRAPLDASGEEAQSMMNKQVGKPWAMITYHKAMKNTMGMNMFRGWLVDFFSVFLLCWMLLKMMDLDFKTALLSSLAVGLIGYMTIPYLDSIWFEGNSLPQLIDTVLQWGICGTWLGWWLTRDRN